MRVALSLASQRFSNRGSAAEEDIVLVEQIPVVAEPELMLIGQRFQANENAVGIVDNDIQAQVQREALLNNLDIAFLSSTLHL